MHDWSRVIRLSAQYAVPGLIALGIIAEFSRALSSPITLAGMHNIGIAVLFSVLTVTLIGMCGWVVFLWDIDRLFYRLERRADRCCGRGQREARSLNGSPSERANL